MGPISTMKLQDTPPSKEERSRREGILNTIQESLGYLESGNRGPEWQMGYIYPPGIRATIPASTQKLASTSRRGIFKQIKKDIHSKLLETERKLAEHVPTNHPHFDMYMRELAAPFINEYKNRVKAVTALPDSVVARVRKTKPIVNEEHVGAWGEYKSPSGKDIGGSLYLKPGMKDTGTTITHEAGHASTGMGKLVNDAVKDKRTRAGKIWKDAPKKSQETLTNFAEVENFDRRYANDTLFGKKRYKENYHRWPGEGLANEAQEIVPAHAGSRKRRLTTDEYLNALHPSAERAAKKARQLDLEFSNESTSRIRDFWHNIIGK